MAKWRTLPLTSVTEAMASLVDLVASQNKGLGLWWVLTAAKVPPQVPDSEV